MPRPRKKARSSSESDDEYAPPASARRPSITVKPREQRDRRAPAAFSPAVETPTRKPRKPKEPSQETDDNSTPAATPARPEHKRLENKIKSQAHRLRYPMAFIDAYEAEGWNKSSLDKLKPNKELDTERRKIAKGQRALVNGLQELKALYANEPQVPPMAVFEDVHCSLCGSTDIEQDNDILLCDSDEPWFCEVCLAIFECLKSINSVFGTTYEDVDDLRSSRSKSAVLPPKPVHKKVSLIGEPAAKIDPKTGVVILGVVAKLEPPAQGRYSRWRIDYRDGSSELLTRSKTQAAINRAAVEDSDDEDGGDSEALIVRGKRKRNEVDYRQLNELMFAGKDEDSEDDETFEVKEGSEEEPDEEEDNEDDGEENEGEGKEESAESVSDQSSPTTVTASHAVSQPLDEKRSREPVDYHTMHEGLLS
ncbi:hypothetical protein JG687_00000358 [Phytophthora cactorum]|uniref:Uncharacterized protein n=1 Tax=Phytophthora cactorum TaxID=29920 RepID=A0A8T1V3Q9_9STRA|nr:hypothetical protein JG687_00000358 [Phytophthora cactorum]